MNNYHRQLLIPEIGKVYRNRGGGAYIALAINEDGNIIFRNAASGWTFVAHTTYLYEDGTIEWYYSTGGDWR